MSILNGLFRRKREQPSLFFSDRREVERFVENALDKAVPAGWKVEREDRKRLCWTIKKVSSPEMDSGWKDYGVIVTQNFEWFIITYGNSSRGPLELYHAMMTAETIPSSSLMLPGSKNDDEELLFCVELSDCVRYVIDHYKPNEWSVT